MERPVEAASRVPCGMEGDGSRMAKHIGLSVLAAILLIASLEIPQEVASQHDLVAVRFGYPVSYVVQNQSRLEPPSFPRPQPFVWSPWEFPARLLPVQAMLSFLVVFGTCELVVFAIKATRMRLLQGVRSAGRK